MLKGSAAGPSEETIALSEMEIDAIGEISNISMGTAATTLSSLIGKKVAITTPRVQLTTSDQLQTDYPLPYVIINVQYTAGLEGENLFVMKLNDAALIADLMMGGDGSNPSQELDEIHLSALSEAMNQMMGSASTSMSTIFNKKVNISPPSLRVKKFHEAELHLMVDSSNEQLIQIVFEMIIEDLVDSEMMQILPLKFAKELGRNLLGDLEGGAKDEKAEPQPAPAAAPVQDIPVQPESQPAPLIPSGAVPPQTSVAAAAAADYIPVQPAQFAPFSSVATSKDTGNLNLILDVMLQFSVELGRTRKSIKDILDLGPGAIVELDKLAGEAVDVLINGKPVAKGEVVVIDENYGVRITEILSSAERLEKLQ